jgi:hypothetical protein
MERIKSYEIAWTRAVISTLYREISITMPTEPPPLVGEVSANVFE